MNTKKIPTKKAPSPLTLSSLCHFNFLSGLKDKDLTAIKNEMEVLYVAAHEVIIHEDMQQEDPPLYLIHKGECQVSKLGLHISTLKANEHFGEMSLLTHKPRATTIKASKPCVLFVMRQRTFNKYLKDRDDVMSAMILTLDNRLRKTNESVSRQFFDPEIFNNTNQNFFIRESSLEFINKLSKTSSLKDVQKMALLFKKQINISKQEEGLSHEVFSLHDLIHHSCRLLDNLLLTQKISFQLILGAKKTDIKGHYEKIQQIFLILLSEAKKSITLSKLKKTPRNITIQTKNINNKIYLDVSDQGKFNALTKEDSILRWPIDCIMKYHEASFKSSIKGHQHNKNILIFKCV